MRFMEWSDRFSIGVAVFDDEHKKLIAIINSLHEALSSGIADADLRRISDNLVEYTLMHFRHEEMYFDDWAYPDAEAHMALHARLREQVFNARRQIQEKNPRELGLDLMEFLRQWLSEHILVEDRKYGRFLFEKGLR
jgi:hemerythrin